MSDSEIAYIERISWWQLQLVPNLPPFLRKPLQVVLTPVSLLEEESEGIWYALANTIITATMDKIS